MKSELLKTIESIVPADGSAKARAKARQDSLAKPPGSLGGLEDIAVKLAGIWNIVPGGDAGVEVSGRDPGTQLQTEVTVDVTGGKSSSKLDTPSLDRGCVLVFCADNGVVAQGVSSAPQSVTRAQTINFTRRLTGVGTLAKSFGSELLIVDMGVKDEIPSELYDDEPLRDTHKIVDRRIRSVTGDISQGPAMTTEEAMQAMMTGIEMAKAAADAGYAILGVGEMGIGNTTTSAAVLSALTGEGSEVTCGRGGGVNDEGFRRKCEIVDACSGRWRDEGGLLKKSPMHSVDTPDDRGELSETGSRASEDEARLDDVVKILATCGGFDICAMAGAFLGAAMRRTPVVIDGYISAVAALAAAVIEPAATDYMFASHKSAEPGYDLAVESMGLDPFLDLGMRLGEGSGCPIAFAVIKGAWDVMKDMATFEEAEINDDYLEEVRRGGCF